MRLSTKGEYASRAMLELSLRSAEGPLHIRDISAAQDIPPRFLEQILLLLKRAPGSASPALGDFTTGCQSFPLYSSLVLKGNPGTRSRGSLIPWRSRVAETLRQNGKL